MIKILLLGNGVNQNKGCEAIVKGLNELFKKYLESKFEIINIVFNNELEEGIDETIPEVKTILYHSKKPNKNLIRAAKLPIIGKSILKRVITSYLSRIIPYIKSADVIVSVGGDNFSNDYGYPRMHLWLLKLAKYFRKKSIIWGASIGPFDLSNKNQRLIVRTLEENTDLFIVREMTSFNNLISYGINKNRIKLLMDPAFYMKPKEITNGSVKEFIISNEFIGMNLSPLIGRFIKNADSNWNFLAKELIIKTQETTKKTIILIPHVDKQNNSDYLFMKELSITSEKIILLEPKYSADELKWIISKALFFIGCRTHSTIAAISTNVPTLSIAYSIKAYGLNQLIFNHEDYVLGVNELNLNTYLQKLQLIAANREQISKALAETNSFLIQQDKVEFDIIKKLF